MNYGKKKTEAPCKLFTNLLRLNVLDTCNLEMEIEQNECRLEHYPLTNSVLDLLYALVSTVIPKNLGGGPRKPGLDPYLNFLINGIFLKFYNR